MGGICGVFFMGWGSGCFVIFLGVGLGVGWSVFMWVLFLFFICFSLGLFLGLMGSYGICTVIVLVGVRLVMMCMGICMLSRWMVESGFFKCSSRMLFVEFILEKM